MKQRFDVYKKETEPLIEFYRKQGILFKVNGDQSADKVFREIMEVVKL